MAAAVAGRQGVRAEAGGGRRQGRHRLVEEARRLQPPDEVAASHPAWPPRSLPAGKDDLAAGFPQLFGHLAARLPAADDQDRPGRQRGLVSVVLDVDLQEVGRQRVGAGGAVGTLERAGGEDDPGGRHVAGGGPGDEAARRPVDRPHDDAFPDGRP